MSTSSKNDTPEFPASYKTNTVSPHLVCAGAIQAISFYEKAFGATEIMRLVTPAGGLMHAAVRIGDSAVLLMEEMPEMHCFGPKTLKGSPVTIHLNVPDADALQKRAVDAGATLVMPVQEMFWGARYGVITDPFGHNWSISTQVRDVSGVELQKAAAAMTCG